MIDNLFYIITTLISLKSKVNKWCLKWTENRQTGYETFLHVELVVVLKMNPISNGGTKISAAWPFKFCDIDA